MSVSCVGCRGFALSSLRLLSRSKHATAGRGSTLSEVRGCIWPNRGVKFRQSSAFVRESRYDDDASTANRRAELHDDEEVDSLTIGRRIRQLRTERGMTLDELAARRRPRAQPAVDDRERPARAEAHAAARDRAGARHDARRAARVRAARRARDAGDRARARDARADLPGPRHPAVPHRQDRADRGARGDAGAAGRDRAPARRARGDARGGAPRERRAAQADAHAEQLLPRARGAGPAAARRRRPPGRSADAADGIRHRRAPGLHAALRARPAADHPQRRRHQERPALPVEPARRRRATRAPRCCRRSRAASSGTASRRATPSSCASAWRRTTSPAPCSIPEEHAVPFLQEAKGRRAISIEDLRDAYSVSYETAAHRFTNLATVHLGIPVHFLKVHESGTITKAYENDDVNFPTDRLGCDRGADVLPAGGRRASCSTRTTTSTRTTSTPTPATARTGARRASSCPARARTR